MARPPSNGSGSAPPPPGGGPGGGGTKTGEGSYRDLGNDAVEFLRQALARAGDPSVTGLKNEPGGGMDPAGPFDCSSLVAVALETMGITAPRTSEKQAKWVKTLSPGTPLQPGDLIFERGIGSPPPGHVVIYLGNGLVIAADEGGPVSIRTFNPATEGVMSIGRPPGLEWNPGATGAQTYLHELDRIDQQVKTSGPITVPLAGIKLPTIGAKPSAQVVLVPGAPNAAALKYASQTKDYSAYETVQQELARWGLSELAPMAYKAAMSGQNAEQIAADIRRTPQYNTAFPGMADRIKAGLPPLSEDAYITYEDAMLGLSHTVALPPGFITRTEIGKLVAQNVSPVEFSQRLQALQSVALKSDPTVRRLFEGWFGVRGALGAMTAYFADPHRATGILTEQVNQAQIGAEAINSGFGALSKAHAAQLAQDEASGKIPLGTSRSDLDKAAQELYLTTGAPGSVAPRVTRTQLLGAQVPGYQGTKQSDAQQAIRSAQSAREAVVEQGGGFAATARGVRGAGGASTEGTPV